LNELIKKANESYKNKDYQVALKKYKEIKKELDKEIFEKQHNFNYMWCIYRCIVCSKESFKEENLSATREYIKYILQHQSNKEILFQCTVFKVIKHLKEKSVFEAKKINKWLDMLNPDLLSNKEIQFEIENRQFESQSNREEWYTLKSKVYEKLEMYEECIEISEKALIKIEKFHNGNEVWLKMRIGLSKNKLGKNDEAINTFKNILKIKKDWFLYFDLCKIYYHIKDIDNTLKYLIVAVQRPGGDDKKVKLFWFFGEVIEELGMESSIYLKTYTIMLKKHNEWKLSNEEEKFYLKHKTYIDVQEEKSIKKEIIGIINEVSQKDNEIINGTIMKILPNGNAGFIKSTNNTYYFKMSDVKS
jgi:hypothetical protein